MALYVRTDYVPEYCDYLTVGKLYEVTNLRENSKGGDIVADNGITCIIYLGGDSAHIDKAWEQVTLEGEQTVTLTLPLEDWLALYRTIGEIQGIGLYLTLGQAEHEQCKEIGSELQEKGSCLTKALQASATVTEM